MGWFKREKQGISTSTADKKETPEGLWYKCPKCKTVEASEDHKANLFVCANCNHHERISAKDYFEILFDSKKGSEFARGIESADPLEFEDTKRYVDRVKAVQAKTGNKDAIRVAHGKMNGSPIVIAAMDFNFIGGSMGSVVGEKIARAIDKAIEIKAPFLDSYTFHGSGNLDLNSNTELNKFNAPIQFSNYDLLCINGNHY